MTIRKGTPSARDARRALAFAFAVCVCAAPFFTCTTNVFNPSGAKPFYGLDATGHVLLGQQYLRDAKPYDAFSEFNQAIALDPAMGAARLGLAKAAFNLYGFGTVEILNLLKTDSIKKRIEIGDIFSWTLSRIDSIYAPVHIADTVLSPLYSRSFRASDGFDPAWIAADYSIVMTIHSFLGLLDFNDDGRINAGDNPFLGISVSWAGDSLVIKGLDELLANDTFKAAVRVKIDSTISDIAAAADVFARTFADTSAYARIDSLLVVFRGKLQERLK
jgi:hypothetical protein